MEIVLKPNLKNLPLFLQYCSAVSKKLKNLDENSFVKTVVDLRFELEGMKSNLLSNNEIELLISKNLVLDLISQGWNVKSRKDSVKLTYPDIAELTLNEEKEKIRKGLLIQRDSQLRISSVREFIKRMERKKLTSKGWHSIFSLMRDGKQLSEELIRVSKVQDDNEKLKSVSNIIKPYIQFVETNKECSITGFQLMDIWRYFRHTWVTPYKVLPGRSISILIRDAAAPSHPVIGIAALGSSVAQHTVRDRWIGWDSETFYDSVVSDPKIKIISYLRNTLDEIINNIYVKDLKDIDIYKSDLQKPEEKIIKKLRSLALKEIKKHRLNPDKQFFNEIKLKNKEDKEDWDDYSKTHLFKSKRYRLLAALLHIKRVFIKHGLFSVTNKKQLVEILKVGEIKDSIKQLIRKVKSDKVGISIMDIIVCGSIAPYNQILSGKLVCMLLASPEVTKYYKSKYGDRQSIIASSMKGKPVRRKQDLVFLGTTSLYGIGSSQYNRIKIPAEELNGDKGNFIEYKNLGLSAGFGTFHFSQTTLDFMKLLLARREGGRRVNSIFGEGANPLMRKIRECLDILNLPSEKILNHGFRRVVYGVSLSENFREVLVGFDKRPKFLIPQGNPKQSTELIVSYWCKRWLVNRINNTDVINELKSNTLSYPITHKARVKLEEPEEGLFE